MKDKTIHVAVAIDDSFVLPLAVLLESLFDNNKDNTISIHLFSVGLKDENIKTIEDIVKKHQSNFKYHQFRQEQFDGLPVSERISYASYYRLLMPETIGNDVDRFLYLDADIIVNGDISPLWDIDMGDNIIASVTDVVASEGERYKKFNIPKENFYFNNGVLLIDKKNWIQNNVSVKTIRYIRENDCRFHDQDGLNAIAFDKRLPLSPIWNQQLGIYFVKKNMILSVYKKEEYIQALRKPVIIHFNGVEKPWHIESWHPFQRQFNKYLKASGQKLVFNQKPLSKRLKKIVYKIYGWGRLNKYYYYKTGQIV